MSSEQPDTELPAATRVGQVALRVGSLDEVVPFYRALGLDVDRRDLSTVLVAADGTQLLVLEEEPELPNRSDDAAGLFHVAIRVPSREALADALGRIREAGLRLTGASDHLVSEALYLRDPEGNGVELYHDLPREAWPRTTDGHVKIDSLPLDVDLLAEEETGGNLFPAGTDVGHVHLEVTDLGQARSFYVDRVGFRIRSPDHRDRASFVAAGDYHHHLGLNVWNGRTDPARKTRGMAWYELVVPDSTVLSALADRLDASVTNGELIASDPDDIRFRVTVGE